MFLFFPLINRKLKSLKGSYLLLIFKLGNHEQAINCFNQAISINRDYYQAFNNKDNYFYDFRISLTLVEFFHQRIDNLGLYEDAITQYDQAININPKYSNAIHNKSEAQKKGQKCMIPIFPKKGLRAQQPQKIIYKFEIKNDIEEREIDLGAAKFSQHD